LPNDIRPSLTSNFPKGKKEVNISVVVKRVIAWQIEQEMKAQKLSKTTMVKKMHTSRASRNK
jgi:antitoxin HicB